jgi:hypothetical protein
VARPLIPVLPLHFLRVQWGSNAVLLCPYLCPIGRRCNRSGSKRPSDREQQREKGKEGKEKGQRARATRACVLTRCSVCAFANRLLPTA